MNLQKLTTRDWLILVALLTFGVWFGLTAPVFWLAAQLFWEILGPIWILAFLAVTIAFQFFFDGILALTRWGRRQEPKPAEDLPRPVPYKLPVFVVGFAAGCAYQLYRYSQFDASGGSI